MACRRHLDDLARGKDFAYVWDSKAANAACAFLETLPHVEGRWASATIRLEPPQVFIVCALFGWRRRDDPSCRRFTTLYWEMGRKGAKSTLMAGIALYHVLEEGEPGPSVICAATTGSQARIVFDITAKMVTRSPGLRARGLRVFANAICLMADGTTVGTFKPINAKASTQDGLNPSCIILDESHAQTFELHDVLKSAQGARRNPLLLCPTTAGYDMLSIGYALRTTLCKVLEGVFVADHLLGAIYTLDEGDDWRDPAVWRKANPLLGVTPSLDYLQRYCQDAQQTPGLEGEFKVKCCSLWAHATSSWLSLTQWDACADPTLRLEQFDGRSCWVGVDLAQTDDLAAVALLFPEDDGRLVGFVRCYLPREVVQERARVVPEYRLWAEAGILRMTEGVSTDEHVIEADIRAWCRAYAVKAICFDEYDSSRLITQMEKDGLPAIRQRKSAKTMTEPARELETRLRERRFVHDGNSCLRWQASNVVITRYVDDSILPKKETQSSPNKIDAIDALLQAIGSYLRTPPPPQYALL